MSKVLNFTITDDNNEERSYVLEYNRYAIKKIEQLGFAVDNVASKLVTNIALMFYGGLIKNHQYEVKSVKVSDRILGKLTDEYDTEDLLEILIDMIIECVPGMGVEKDSSEKKKLTVVDK